MQFGAADGDEYWAARLARTPFAAVLAKGAPLIVARGDPARLAFASPAAISAFGAADARALGDLLFEGDGLGSRRLARLALEMPADAPPRLERLRYFVALKPLSIAWICARIRRDGETFFVAAEPVGPLEDSEPAAAPAPPRRFAGVDTVRLGAGRSVAIRGAGRRARRMVRRRGAARGRNARRAGRPRRARTRLGRGRRGAADVLAAQGDLAGAWPRARPGDPAFRRPGRRRRRRLSGLSRIRDHRR